jgi:gluconolactonase
VPSRASVRAEGTHVNYSNTSAGLASVLGGDHALGVVQSGFMFTEGPVWHPDGYLVFSDIPASTMYRWDADHGVQVFKRPSHKTNGNTLDRQGRLVSCQHLTSRVVRAEHDGTETVLADSFGGAELNSPNDVIVSSDGTVYFTDPDFGRVLDDMGAVRDVPQAVRGVYRFDEMTGVLTRIIDDCAEPNGLCLSLDERYLYVNDTARGHIRRFTVGETSEAGSVIWAHPEGTGAGSVDGMKFDSMGNLYCTGPGGVFVYDAEAVLLGVIAVPEAVGNFTWGGSDLRTMFFCASTTVYSCPVLVPGLALV